MPDKSPSWITVYKAWGPSEADVVKGLLESNGIRCLQSSNAAPSVHAFNIDGMGEIRLKVPEADAETARKLIEQEPPDFSEV